MEPELIAAAGAGGFALLTLILLLLTRRGRAKARRRATVLQRDLDTHAALLETSRAGEREAVWALDATTSTLDAERLTRAADLRRLVELEGALDDLRHRLADADQDVGIARREADEALTEVARLETELAGIALREDPDPPVADDAHLLERLDQMEEALAAERLIVERLRADLADVRSAPDDGDHRERLVSSEARRRDLEDRLSSLHAVRSAEQRTAADRIAGLERLHLQIGEREERIEGLETDLKQVTEARDEALEEAARLEVEIVRLRGELAEARQRLATLEDQGADLKVAAERIAELEQQIAGTSGAAAEIDRLRKSLDAERARAERIGRRAAETGTDATYAMWDRVVRERVETAVARDTARLTAQIEHLRVVVEEKEARLAELTSGEHATLTPSSEPPPITAIKGIGPVIAGILADHGIETMAEIAALSETDIDRLGAVMPVYPGRIRADDWVGQAQSFL